MIYNDPEQEKKYLITVLTDDGCFKKAAKDRKFLAKHLFSVKGHSALSVIIDAITRKFAKPVPIDTAFNLIRKQLSGKIKDQEVLEDYYTLLENILDTPAEPESFDYLYDSLTEYARARKVKATLEKGIECLELDNLDAAETMLQEFRQTEVSSTFVKHSNVVDGYTEYRKIIEEKMAHPENYRGVRTGFKLIDTHPDWMGTYRGEMYLVLAYTKRGKSFFLMEVGYQAALQGLKVVHATIEMSDYKAKTRFYSRLAGIRANWLKTPTAETLDTATGDLTWMNRLTPEELEKLDEAVANMRNRDMMYHIMSFNKGTTVADIEAELKQLPFNPDVLVVDHLPDMKPSKEYKGSSKSWDAIGDVSWEMCQLARNWNDQQGLILWTANQAKSECEYDEYLTVESSAYSKLPVTHASATVYLAQNRDDERMDIRRFGIINARDSGQVTEVDTLVSNLSIGRLHDSKRAESPEVRQYLRRIIGNQQREESLR